MQRNGLKTVLQDKTSRFGPRLLPAHSRMQEVVGVAGFEPTTPSPPD
jgi:hypothetical protein